LNKMENRDYSVVYRLMHWAIAACMLILLITIIIRMVWMNTGNVADIIQRYLTAHDNASLSREDLIRIAKQIRQPMWMWHVYTGYTLVGLFCLRMVLPFSDKMKFSNPLDKQLTSFAKFQYWVYLIFYCGMAISLITGLVMEFGPRSLKLLMIKIHNLSNYFLIPFLIIHLGGVLIAEFKNQKGIISKIVSGT
jgi:cytochrome b561